MKRFKLREEQIDLDKVKLSLPRDLVEEFNELNEAAFQSGFEKLDLSQLITRLLRKELGAARRQLNRPARSTSRVGNFASHAGGENEKRN